MHVLLDTNVVLDFLLEREPWHSEADLLWQALRSSQIIGYVLASSITDIYYVIRRLRGSAIALLAVQTCLGVFRTAQVGRDDLEAALQRTGSDFEDNLQIACAVRDMLDAIITRDAEGFRDSPIPALSPAEALQRLGT